MIQGNTCLFTNDTSIEITGEDLRTHADIQNNYLSEMFPISHVLIRPRQNVPFYQQNEIGLTILVWSSTSIKWTFQCKSTPTFWCPFHSEHRYRIFLSI